MGPGPCAANEKFRFPLCEHVAKMGPKGAADVSVAALWLLPATITLVVLVTFEIASRGHVPGGALSAILIIDLTFLGIGWLRTARALREQKRFRGTNPSGDGEPLP